MKPIRFGLLALSLGTASCATVANETVEAPPKLGKLERASYYQCLDQAKGRLEQALCIQTEKEWQLKQLDLLYQHLAAKLNDEQRQALAKSEAAWKAQMDLELRLAQSVYDPQGLDLEVEANEIKWAIHRRQQLQRYLGVLE